MITSPPEIMIAAPVELAALASAFATTALGAIRTWFGRKQSKRTITIEAGEKEWKIDTSGLSHQQVQGIIKDLSEQIESETPGSPEPPATDASG
jgi:hypothetical protein